MCDRLIGKSASSSFSDKIITSHCYCLSFRPTGQLVDDHFDGCFIRAHANAAEVLRCEVADNLSCLMVMGSEELLSRVMKLRILEGSTLRFPVCLAVPFCARYRGSYRDVAVKMVDEGRRASYITPVTTEGVYGGHRVRLGNVPWVSTKTSSH